eukprot:jgi/Undpi1/13057/HiC_scaffold_8.g02719.m1
MGVERETKGNTNLNHSRQLDFDPQSFVNIGSLLNAQERRPTAVSSTQTTDEAPLAADIIKAGRRVILSLLAVVVVLLGTNAFLYSSSRAWKAEQSSLQAKIAELESAAAKTCESQVALRMPYDSCPGSDLVDTCWFKVGLGNCAKEVLVKPVERVEGAWRFAWDSTAEVIGAIGETIANDFHTMSRELHSFASAALDVMGLNCGSF